MTPSTDGLPARLRGLWRRTGDPRSWLDDPRVRAATLGLALSVIAVPLLVHVVGWPVREASSTVFALGALVLGFAVTSWAGSLLLESAIEGVQAHLGLAHGWTEAGARLAFSVLSAFGVGVMAGSVFGTIIA